MSSLLMHIFKCRNVGWRHPNSLSNRRGGSRNRARVAKGGFPIATPKYGGEGGGWTSLVTMCTTGLRILDVVIIAASKIVC